MSIDLKKMAPAILTGLGVIGVGITAVISAKNHTKALPEIKKLKEENPTITKKEIVKGIWKNYIPSLAAGGITIACVIASNRLSAKEIATITAAASLAIKQTQIIKSKARAIVGEEKWKEIEKALGDDAVCERIEERTDILETGEVAFYDTFTNEAFYKSEREVRQAMYAVNRILALEGKVSIGDFYELMHEHKPWYGDVYGWSVDMNPTEEDICEWIDIELEKVDSSDKYNGTIYYKIVYENEPTSNYVDECDKGTDQMSAFERAYQTQGLPFK